MNAFLITKVVQTFFVFGQMLMKRRKYPQGLDYVKYNQRKSTNINGITTDCLFSFECRP